MTDTYEILNFISETAAAKNPEPENVLAGSIFTEGGLHENILPGVSFSDVPTLRFLRDFPASGKQHSIASLLTYW